MTTYRRNFVAGGFYFFTVNLAERRLQLLTDNIELLHTAFRYRLGLYPATWADDATDRQNRFGER